MKKRLLKIYDDIGAEYPAEHNVGAEYLAKPSLSNFSKKFLFFGWKQQPGSSSRRLLRKSCPPRPPTPSWPEPIVVSPKWQASGCRLFKDSHSPETQASSDLRTPASWVPICGVIAWPGLVIALPGLVVA